MEARAYSIPILSAAAPATPAQPSAPPAAAPPSDDILRQKIVGSWGQTPACPDGHLTFNADGSFQSAGANQSDAVTGTYTIDGGHLAGTSGDSEMPTMLVNFDGEMLLLDDGSGSPQRLNRCTTPQ